MKKIFSLVLLFVSIFYAGLQAQGFNYQTVLRNSTAVEVNKSVALKFTILKDSESGTSVYEETHNVTTNEFGVISVVVGAGTPVSGDFETIDWGAASYFMNVEIDAEDMGTSQLNSLPFANYAKKSGMATEAVNADTAGVAMDLEIANAATGDVLYFDGTNWVRLAAGSNGEVLTLETGMPAWKAPSVAAAEPKLGEAFSGGTIVGIYPNGDVLVVYNTQIKDGPILTFDYTTALTKVPSGWHIPTKKEFTVIAANAYLLPDAVWFNSTDYLQFWTSTGYTGGGNFIYFEGFFQPNELTQFNRVLVVKKVPYN